MSKSYNDDDFEPSFSLSDFKKWMASQNDQPKRRRSHLTGLHVESKIVSTKRLMAKIEPEEGERHELASEFRQHGGIILDHDEDYNLLIEVDSGTFRIPRYFVRRVR